MAVTAMPTEINEIAVKAITIPVTIIIGVFWERNRAIRNQLM